MKINHSTALLLVSAAGLTFLLGCKTDHKILINAERTSAFDLYSEGEFLESQGQYQSALNTYLRAHEISPRPAFAYKIGELYHRMGNPSKAIPLYESALSGAPDFELAKAQLSLAQTQIKENQSAETIQQSFVEAEAKAQQTETATPDSTLDQFQPSTKEQPLAETLPKEAVRDTVFPELQTEALSTNELLEKARLAEKNGQWNDASTYYQELRKTDLSEETLLAHARALSESGRLHRAQELLEENVVFLKPSETYYVTWSNLLAKGDRLEEAETVLQKGLKSFAGSNKLKNNLGALYFKQGLFKESQLILDELLKETPDYLPAQYNLALTCIELNDYPKAKKLLQSYVAANGDQSVNAQNLLQNPVFFP